MNSAVTATVALAGFFFSLTCAFLLEELMFGMVFRLMACSQKIRAASKERQSEQTVIVSHQGETPCLR
jgi:hypothetical protein